MSPQLRFAIAIILFTTKIAFAEDLAEQTTESCRWENGTCQSDHPSSTESPSNTTLVKSTEIFIRLSHALPGTKYKFKSALITTAPLAPSNFSLNLTDDGTALLKWKAPTVGGFSGYKVALLGYLDNVTTAQTMNTTLNSYIWKNLTLGGSYYVQVYTVYEGLESVAYVSHNFTLKSTTSGRFTLWFRNETALMVLWHPGDVAGHYVVSIDPADASEENVLYVECEGEPPGPARAGFKQLIPGRLYNISVQPVAEDRWPISVQYRTIPLPPLSLTYDLKSLKSGSLRLSWKAPEEFSEFDRYQISINDVGKQNGGKKEVIFQSGDEPTACELGNSLQPGGIYQIEVRTVSAKMTSSPATLNLTMKPLPVKDLTASFNSTSSGCKITWLVDDSSYQDVFEITYFDADLSNNPHIISLVKNKEHDIEYLPLGGNYSISVVAISNGVKSNRTAINLVIPPSTPFLKKIQPIDFGLDISWRPAYVSIQDSYIVIATRNDSRSEKAITITTIEPKLTLKGLYPGAEYNITIIAVSHGVRSEAQFFFQTVRPKPPRNLTQRRTGRYSMLFRWLEPIDSVFDQYSIWFRVETDTKWMQYTNSKDYAEIEFTKLSPDVKYLIQVDTISRGVRSTHTLWSNIIL